jgi:hypothetical protein
MQFSKFPILNKLSIRLGVTTILITSIVIQFFFNREFWLDEAMLAAGVRDLTPLQLLGKLPYCQVAPLGILLLTKALTLGFGQSEMIYRIPMLLASLYAVYRIYIRHDIYESPMLILLVSTVFVYYSSEFKQYIFDFLFAVILIETIFDNSYKKTFLALSVGLFFTNTVFIFIVPALFSIYVINHRSINTSLLKETIIYLIGIAVAFGMYFFVFVNDNPCKGIMVDYHIANLGIYGNSGYLNSLISSFTNFTPIFHYLLPLGLRPLFAVIGFILLALIIFATVQSIIKDHERRTSLFILLSILFAILFSVTQKYPFGGRFSLYMFPFIMVAFSQWKLKFPKVLVLVALLFSLLPFFIFRHPSKFPFTNPVPAPKGIFYNSSKVGLHTGPSDSAKK